jgi:hypothetical protein
LVYTRYCDVHTPTDFKTLSSGFVYTFEDCIELCAGYSGYTPGGDGKSCNVAVYDVQQVRPVNCVVGSMGVAAEGLGVGGGLAVALLKVSV